MPGSIAETARLLVSLDFKDNLSKGLKSANASLGWFEGSVGRIGGLAQQGVGNASRNLAKIGVVAGAAIGVAVKSGIESLAELETAITSVDGAITQMGLSGKTTGSEIAGWANEIETAIGAAFDDKAITAATATLIRYGKVAPANIRPAMEVMTDLAAKTGSVESASELLAKALADPTKAAGKLARQGVVLTKSQQATIKAMVEAGDAAGAQAFLLRELEKTTKGAAAASQGPYKRAMSVLADVTEDAQRALAEGFLPVLMRASEILSKALADPKVIANIRSFGKSLATGLDSLISIAQNLPWSQIGASLQLAGAGAKAVLGAFTALPPWIQTAVLTGWGLNKLTGGAIGSIGAELAKGLIGGALGQRGATPANPLFTKEVGLGGGAGGGLPKGAPAVAAGGLGAAGLGTLAAMVAAPILMNLVIPYLTKGEKGMSGLTLKTNTAPAQATTAVLNTIAQSMTATQQNTARTKGAVDDLKAETAAVGKRAIGANAAGDERTAARIASLNSATKAGSDKVAAAAAATRAATSTGLAAVKVATSAGLAATSAAANRTANVIASKRWQFTNNVNVQNTTVVSVRAVTNSQRTVARYTSGRQTSTTIL